MQVSSSAQTSRLELRGRRADPRAFLEIALIDRGYHALATGETLADLASTAAHGPRDHLASREDVVLHDPDDGAAALVAHGVGGYGDMDRVVGRRRTAGFIRGGFDEVHARPHLREHARVTIDDGDLHAHRRALAFGGRQ